jgi:hypothetical protein
MPRMNWETFELDHHRPHLIVLTMEASEPAPSVAKVDLELLALTLGVSGNYAIKEEGPHIYVAFESDADAARLARVVRPSQSTRDWDWASKALARIDEAAYQRITDTLKHTLADKH